MMNSKKVMAAENCTSFENILQSHLTFSSTNIYFFIFNTILLKYLTLLVKQDKFTMKVSHIVSHMYIYHAC